MRRINQTIELHVLERYSVFLYLSRLAGGTIPTEVGAFNRSADLGVRAMINGRESSVRAVGESLRGLLCALRTPGYPLCTQPDRQAALPFADGFPVTYVELDLLTSDDSRLVPLVKRVMVAMREDEAAAADVVPRLAPHRGLYARASLGRLSANEEFIRVSRASGRTA